jgi:hypothetical protein
MQHHSILDLLNFDHDSCSSDPKAGVDRLAGFGRSYRGHRRGSYFAREI